MVLTKKRTYVMKTETLVEVQDSIDVFQSTMSDTGSTKPKLLKNKVTSYGVKNLIRILHGRGLSAVSVLA